ncbi:hypothetical protein V6N11_025342 [Hibiscus sabdariffa]|uniref:RNase H type-1 domain-containing protein n=1 Tax=Hibiscus sabdariffa TaxID=183260 RepID=A0ABR2A756_9ROSI
MESRANIGEATAFSPMFSRFFSEVWGVSLPNKLKITMWRIVHNFLPTFANLQARWLKPLSYGINFAYQSLASVWKDWLAQTFLGLSLAHKKALMETEMTLVRASPSPPLHQAKWFAPPVDVVKVNFDSAFSLQTRQSVSGVICRDSEGDSRTIVQKCQANSSDLSLISPVIADIKALVVAFINVSFGFVPRTANMVAHTLAQEGKVFACPMFWGEEAPPRTMLAAEKGRLTLDRDSRTIVQKCQANSSDLSLISPVIADIKALVVAFINVSFGFVPRTANMVAHTLAQEGKVFACPMFWGEEAPPRTMLAAEKGRLTLDSS